MKVKDKMLKWENLRQWTTQEVLDKASAILSKLLNKPAPCDHKTANEIPSIKAHSNIRS